MSALYALLGIAIGVAISEVARRRFANAGKEHRTTPNRGSRGHPAAPPPDDERPAHLCHRFLAQDYYDR